MKTSVVFILVSARDIVFFGAVGERLREQSFHVQYVSLFDFGLDYLRNRGFQVATPSVADRSYSNDDSVMPHESAWFHEWYTFGRKPGVIQLRYAWIMKFMNKVFSESSIDFVIQELGGFSCHHAVFDAARFNGVQHLFIEPSFFNGRYFLLYNCWLPKYSKLPDPSVASLRFSEDYLSRYRSEKTVVKPNKDRAHFTSPWKKIANSQRVIMFFIKLHLLCQRKTFVFDYPFQQLASAFSAFFQDLALHWLRRPKGWEHQMSDNTYYFPLHAPKDVALTVRERSLVDQVSLIEKLASALPTGVTIVAKEHPAFRGAIGFRELLRLTNVGVLLLHPQSNSFDIISRCSGVITINSKAGAEALIQGKPVFAFGSPFYQSFAGLVTGGIDECLAWLTSATPSVENSEAKRVAEFAGLAELSLPGELYDLSDDSLDLFANSLENALISTKFLTND